MGQSKKQTNMHSDTKKWSFINLFCRAPAKTMTCYYVDKFNHKPLIAATSTRGVGGILERRQRSIGTNIVFNTMHWPPTTATAEASSCRCPRGGQINYSYNIGDNIDWARLMIIKIGFPAQRLINIQWLSARQWLELGSQSEWYWSICSQKCVALNGCNVNRKIGKLFIYLKKGNSTQLKLD